MRDIAVAADAGLKKIQPGNEPDRVGTMSLGAELVSWSDRVADAEGQAMPVPSPRHANRVGALVFWGLLSAVVLPLSAKAQDKSRPPLDRYGDPLPPGALARLGTIRFRTLSRYVPSAAFSPDGALLATCTFEGRVSLWEATTGKLLHRFTLNVQSQPTFTRDGKVLTCGGVFWNVADGKPTKARDEKELFRPDRKDRLPEGVIATSADGNFLAGVRETTVFVRDRAGNETCRFQGHDHVVWGLAFAPGGRTLASTGEDGTVRLWEPATGKLLATFAPWTGQGKFVRSVGFSPDGKILVAPVGDWLRRVHSGMHAFPCLVLRRWDPVARNELASWVIPAEPEFGGASLAFAPDGKTLAFDGGSGAVVIWSVTTAKEVRCLFDPHARKSSSLAYSPDGKLLAASSEDTRLAVWDLASGKKAKAFAAEPPGVCSVAFSPDGKFLAGGDRSAIHLWEVATGKEKTTFTG